MNENEEHKKSDKMSTILDTGQFSYEVEQLEKLAAYAIETGFTPLDTKEEAITAILKGREVGLKPMVSLTDVYPIKGRASLSIHAMVSIALQHNIKLEILEDYVPIYSYTDKDGNYISEEFVIEHKNSFTIADKKDLSSSLVIDKIKELNKPTVIRSVRDRVTRCKASRVFVNEITGEKEERSTIGEFYYSTAIKSKLIKAGGAWDNNPKNQMKVRAKSNALADIADDLMNGMYNTNAMLDYEGIVYNTDDEGKITEIITEDKEEETVQEVEVKETTIKDPLKE